MVGEPNKFQTLFKKYRLKAEFATLSDLGNALAGKGLIYEDSIFSHWQNGTRIPQNRGILLKLLEIFIERGAITTLEQANGFLSSAKQGYLSEDELQRLHLETHRVTFQVPHDILHFSGRQDIISKLAYHFDLKGKVVLIHGAAGVGKTALAIRLGHLLKSKYNDGVLWYKVEEDNIMDILFSAAHTFGEDISSINDLKVRGTVVRSLLASRHVLFFLDSAELFDDIHLLIPDSPLCTTILTSQKNYLKTPIRYIDVKVNTFTDKEVLSLFKTILHEKYSHLGPESILKIAKKLGNLPLALHMVARQLLHSEIRVTQLHQLLSQENYIFKDMYYEDKNLHTAIGIVYNKLDNKMKSVLVSASIFKGKDFSRESIGYINGLAISSTVSILQNLVDLSLIEKSTKNRYRIHPAIREFVRDKLDYPRSSNLVLIAIFIFIFFGGWWVTIFLAERDNLYLNAWYAASYVSMAVYGGTCGIHTSLKWGGVKTLLGRAIFVFSLGLFMQVFGQLAYAYYTNIEHIQVPYPSLGDIGYFGTIPLYTYGSVLLAKSSGIKISLRSFKKKALAMIIPLVTLMLGYVLFLRDYTFDFTNPLKIFLDFAYPLGDAIYVSIALIIFIFSRTVLDGIMRSKALLLLIALFLQFSADYIFLFYQNIYQQGNFIDFVYLISYFVMTLALLNLKSLQVKIKSA